jgi:molybdopterin molybdotransferase
MSDIPPLLPYEVAQEKVLAAVQPLPSEWVRLEEAVGRATCSEVRARRTLPPWDNSAMDGYAVRAADTGPGVRLEVVEAIFAGQRPTRRLGPGQCARIMTGAPVPEGADAVQMQERVQVHGGQGLGSITLNQAVAPGTHVRSAGEDARAGEVLLETGTLLGIPDAALLWAQGISEVEVPRRPSVAIVSTGDELCRPDEAGGDRIVDTNSPSLALAVRAAGGRASVLGIARDDPAQIERLIEAGLSHDVLLTSAGVSVGERDFIRPTLAKLGVAIDFHGVAIRPGKPVAFGRRGGTLVFGLPGNPLSSLVTFELFVRPALRQLLGHPRPLAPFVGGRLDGTLAKKKGLAHFVRVRAEARDGALWAVPLPTQTSGALRSGVGATHLLHAGMSVERLESGAAVELLPLAWSA